MILTDVKGDSRDVSISRKYQRCWKSQCRRKTRRHRMQETKARLQRELPVTPCPPCRRGDRAEHTAMCQEHSAPTSRLSPVNNNTSAYTTPSRSPPCSLWKHFSFDGEPTPHSSSPREVTCETRTHLSQPRVWCRWLSQMGSRRHRCKSQRLLSSRWLF